MNQSNATKPTREDLRHFLEIFRALDGFEAQHRHLRGWGLFDPEKQQVPDPVVMRVTEWLAEYTGEGGTVQ